MPPVYSCAIYRSTDRRFPRLKLPIQRSDVGKLPKNAFIKLPKHLQRDILCKMDQKSFTRMRRTTRGVEKFVDKNRKVFNFAMCSGWHISFLPFRNGDVTVAFHSPPMPADEIEEHEKQMDKEKSENDAKPADEKKPFHLPHSLVVKHIHQSGKHKHIAFLFSLKMFNRFKCLRDEFVGVTDIISVKNNVLDINGETATRVGQFLKDLGVVKIQKLATVPLSPASLNIFFNFTQPNELHIDHLHGEVPNDIFSHARFSSLRKLKIDVVQYYVEIRNFAPNIEEYTVQHGGQRVLDDGQFLIEKFLEGVSNLKNIRINGIGFITMRHHGTFVYNKQEARKLVYKAYSDAKMEFTYHDRMLVYAVECDTTKEKGVCITYNQNPDAPRDRPGPFDLFFKRIPHNE